MKQWSNLLKDYFGGRGSINVEDNKVYGENYFIGEYLLEQFANGYKFSFGNDAVIEVSNDSELELLLESIFADYEMSLMDAKVTRELYNEIYHPADFDELEDMEIHSFNDTEKNELAYHINTYKLDPEMTRVFDGREDMMNFWLKENSIYTTEVEVDRKVYLSNVDYGEFCMLSTGRIAMFDLE